ncbi:MAG: geranylgeranyl reductase family protein [Chloroflexota bacterium]|nr:geranylgeranyl reductase family protein [Chloroflexota bacterium]MDE2919880.1 geranylgeranyl reductase family protein [Chloroflexota bacterium]
MTRACDLLVVGGGPAGAAAAIAARRAAPELSTVVLDRQKFPRDKACGDGLGPGVVARLADLDATGIVRGRRPVERLKIVAPSGAEVVGDLPAIGRSARGYVVPRSEFDRDLLAHARDAGAEVLTESRLEGLASPEDGPVRVTSSGSNGSESIEARAVIAADGARSDVRRLLGVAYNDPAHTGVAIRAYVERPGGFEHMAFYFKRELLPAYGWIFPIDEQGANVGVMIDAARFQRQERSLPELLRGFLQSSGHADLEPKRSRAYMLPFASEIPPLAHGRVALAGDAGSMINPFSGEGIAYGMAAGMEAATRAARALRSGTGKQPFQGYDAWFRQRFGEHFRASARAKRLAQQAWIADFGVRAARRRPEFVREGIELLVGEGTVLSWRSLARLLVHGRTQGIPRGPRIAA